MRYEDIELGDRVWYGRDLCVAVGHTGGGVKLRRVDGTGEPMIADYKNNARFAGLDFVAGTRKGEDIDCYTYHFRFIRKADADLVCLEQEGCTLADFARDNPDDYSHKIAEMITGWGYHYSGPGRAFTHRPITRIGRNHILITQTAGLDV